MSSMFMGLSGGCWSEPRIEGGVVKMFWGDREGRPAGVGTYDFDRGQNVVKMA